MSNVLFKLSSAAIIFLIAILAGLLPGKFKTRNWLNYGEAFSYGVFLSAGLFDFLPEAENTFDALLPDNHFTYAHLICGIVFAILYILERCLAHCRICPTKQHTYLTPYLLTITLIIHSFIVGSAFGLNNNFAELLIIFIAIITHKGAASFALATNLYQHEVKPRNILFSVILFSLTTPLAIIIATPATSLITSSAGSLLEATFNAIAAGTFLYLGVVNRIIAAKDFANCFEIIIMLTGLALMSLISILI